MRLESRYGLGVRSYEDWSHLWLGNPVYRELRGDWNIGWVIEDENRRIVGSLGNIPLPYSFQGRSILASSGRALVAEPPYRSACLLLLDHLINHNRGDLYLNNTIGSQAEASLQLFDCARVPMGVWNQAAFWITQYNEFFECLLMRTYPRLARPLCYPLAAGAFLKDWLSGRQGLREGDVEVKAGPRFDDRFDYFWEEVQGKRPGVLLAVRTREMLEWHFARSAAKDQLWIATVHDGPRLISYAIFDRKDSVHPGFTLKRVRLVDFQSLDGSTVLLAPLLSWALKRCRSEGIHVLENVGRWLEKGEPMDRAAPYTRILPVWTYCYRAHTPGLASSLRNPDAWVPSLYDGDASL
jgi:hypothetical protein